MKKSHKFSLQIFREPKRDSKSGHVLYLMVHVPWFMFWKIGIGHDAFKRAKQVDRAMFGFPFPVMALFIPGAYFVEQTLHRQLSFFSVKFYDGDGSSEWFLFPVAPIVFLLMLSGWLGYIGLFDLIYGTDFMISALHYIADFLSGFLKN